MRGFVALAVARRSARWGFPGEPRLRARRPRRVACRVVGPPRHGRRVPPVLSIPDDCSAGVSGGAREEAGGDLPAHVQRDRHAATADRPQPHRRRPLVHRLSSCGCDDSVSHDVGTDEGLPDAAQCGTVGHARQSPSSSSALDRSRCGRDRGAAGVICFGLDRVAAGVWAWNAERPDRGDDRGDVQAPGCVQHVGPSGRSGAIAVAHPAESAAGTGAAVVSVADALLCESRLNGRQVAAASR